SPIGDRLDRLTGNYISRTFSLEDIKNLYLNISSYPQFEGTAFYNKLEEAYNHLRYKDDYMLELRNEAIILYQDIENYEYIEKFLVWLFMLTMWIRFWKGPGYELPLATIKGQQLIQMLQEQKRCLPVARNFNINLQAYAYN